MLIKSLIDTTMTIKTKVEGSFLGMVLFYTSIMIAIFIIFIAIFINKVEFIYDEF